jgi:putative transport protein
MTWILDFLRQPSSTATVLVLSLVAATGLGLGTLRIKGVRLGVAGVLFTGLAFGHFGLTGNLDSLRFLRDLGLILFVFTIGMQIGPGFLPSLRRQGVLLNLLAAAVVVIGALVTVGLAALARLPGELAAGLFCGATTNTPALGAAQEALGGVGARASAAAAGYAVAYPLGVIGVILALVALRWIFRVDVPQEVQAFEESRRRGHARVTRATLRVENPQLEGLRLRDMPGLTELGVVVSRILPGSEGEVQPARPDTLLRVGDLMLAVGTEEKLARFGLIVGPKSERDLMAAPGKVAARRILVTRGEVLGKPLAELGLDQRYGVIATRLARAGVEMTAQPDLELQFGDGLEVVGEEAAIQQAAAVLGNSPKELDVTRFGGIFLGIALGVLLGSLPLPPRDLPVPLTLGLAGGPLLAAIILSSLGRLGSIVFYMPTNANLAVRELGIVLFLASVGLASGERFVASVMSPEGMSAFGVGALITVVPVLLVAAVARLAFRLNYATLCGLVAGSMTDPPALAFSGAATGSDAPSVAYATVYPLTMLLRVITAQLLVLLWMRLG